jgi:signal transduction histidine kinase
VGENLLMVVLGATIASAAELYASGSAAIWTSPVLLRVVFLYTAALFYGHVLGRLKSERVRGDRSEQWARVLEAKVAERTAELQRLYDASRSASKAKSEFVASMSHELRTPLHIIIGYADILLDRPGPDDATTLAGHIRRAAAGLLHLVDGVLEMGRLDSGNVRITPLRVPLAVFVEDLRRREWIAPLSGVVLRWDVEPGSVQVETDPAKLQIVLSNLITNALKYTHNGEIVVSVRDRPIARRVELRVDDTGPGIPAPQLARIREPFHESSGRGPHGLAGVGLGLTIVYRYSALLGAAVSVHSTVGHGTSFVVTVPYDYEPARTEPAAGDPR